MQTRLRLGQYRAGPGGRGRGCATSSARTICSSRSCGTACEIEQRVTPRACAGSPRDLGLPLVATNDAHYTRREDAGPHEALLCVQTATTLADPAGSGSTGNSYYLQEPARDARAAARDEDWQAACDATLLIAERAERQLRPART